MPPTALIIEDSEEFVTLGRKLLEREGFEVLVAMDGETGVDLARSGAPELMLVDITLPGMDGFEACRLIRQFSDAYILMVTSRSEEIEKVVGFRVGADDYVTKPYSSAELSARIAAVRRRPRSAPEGSALVCFEDLEVDLDARLVRRTGEGIDLTRTEFDLLRLLVENPRRALSRSQLLEGVWGSAEYTDDHVVDVHMANLRRKLGESSTDPRHVQTVRGVGYRFEPTPSA